MCFEKQVRKPLFGSNPEVLDSGYVTTHWVPCSYDSKSKATISNCVQQELMHMGLNRRSTRRMVRHAMACIRDDHVILAECKLVDVSTNGARLAIAHNFSVPTTFLRWSSFQN